MSMIALDVFFAAHDSLFFRGSRPHAAAGSSSLPSEFPPAASTLSGSLRTRLGDALGVCWKSFSQGQGMVELDGDSINLEELIGNGEHAGQMHFGEVKLYKAGARLYPMPAILLETDKGELLRMELGSAVRCDLGNVRLGQLPTGTHAKPLENAWLTHSGYERFLQGQMPAKTDVVKVADLFKYEERLGIGRNNQKATVESGLLYQTAHLRLQPDVEFAIEVTLPKAAASLLEADVRTNPVQRLGGEGRMAMLRTAPAVDGVQTCKGHPSVLMLLTDMLPDSDFTQQPLSGLQPAIVDGVDCWEGAIHGVGVRLWSVASGKARRVGGWDTRRHQPREVQSFIPAGSCFYVEPLDDSQDLTLLHGKAIGRRTDFGFGTLVCALSH